MTSVVEVISQFASISVFACSIALTNTGWI